MTSEVKRILLVEDNANDAELTLTALAENNFANEVDLVRDGAEALDYLYRRDKFVEYVFSGKLIRLLKAGGLSLPLCVLDKPNDFRS